MAVKQLNLSGADRSAFLAEAKLMKRMRAHLNVVRLYGVCTNPANPLCLVTEFMPGGDLLSHLKAYGRPAGPMVLHAQARIDTHTHTHKICILHTHLICIPYHMHSAHTDTNP